MAAHTKLLFVSKMSRRQAIIGGQGDGLKCLLCFALADICTAALTASSHFRRLQTPAQLHNGTQQSSGFPKGCPDRGEETLAGGFEGHFNVRLAMQHMHAHAHHDML
jgi:hypothetical protein